MGFLIERLSERLFEDGSDNPSILDNPFVLDVHSYIGKFNSRYKIIYIDKSSREITLSNEMIEIDCESVTREILSLVDRDCKKKGWVKEDLVDELTNYIYDTSEIESVLRHSVNSEPKYNPAEDPYYHNEDLYIPNEINFS